MTTIQLTVPEEIFASLRRSPDELAGELRVADAGARAIAHPGCLAVIDDLEGRRCAETLGVHLAREWRTARLFLLRQLTS